MNFTIEIQKTITDFIYTDLGLSIDDRALSPEFKDFIFDIFVDLKSEQNYQRNSSLYKKIETVISENQSKSDQVKGLLQKLKALLSKLQNEKNDESNRFEVGTTRNKNSDDHFVKKIDKYIPINKKADGKSKSDLYVKSIIAAKEIDKNDKEQKDKLLNKYLTLHLHKTVRKASTKSDGDFNYYGVKKEDSTEAYDVALLSAIFGEDLFFKTRIFQEDGVNKIDIKFIPNSFNSNTENSLLRKSNVKIEKSIKSLQNLIISRLLFNHDDPELWNAVAISNKDSNIIDEIKMIDFERISQYNYLLKWTLEDLDINTDDFYKIFKLSYRKFNDMSIEEDVDGKMIDYKFKERSKVAKEYISLDSPIYQNKSKFTNYLWHWAGREFQIEEKLYNEYGQLDLYKDFLPVSQKEFSKNVAEMILKEDGNNTNSTMGITGSAMQILRFREQTLKDLFINNYLRPAITLNHMVSQFSKDEIIDEIFAMIDKLCNADINKIQTLSEKYGPKNKKFDCKFMLIKNALITLDFLGK